MKTGRIGNTNITLWSYSRLTAFEQCPMMYKLKYIDRMPDEPNAFSQYGTFCHGL